jgi:hypothetical protein
MVNFEFPTSGVEENDAVSVTVLFSGPTTRTEYITFSVSSSSAEFGKDFGLNNLLFFSEEFTIAIDPGSVETSFTFNALRDFEDEPAEEVHFEIEGISDGLALGDPISTSISIINVEDYPVDNRTLVFDGIDDYVDLGNIYDDLVFPITISAWIWMDPDTPNGIIPIFNSQDGDVEYNGLNFISSNGSNVAIQYGDGKGYNHPAYRRTKSALFAPIDSRWVNFTGVVRGATDMDLYFNGVDVGGTYMGSSDFPMNSNAPNAVAKIGYYFLNGVIYRFKGKIDEVRIWNRSLTRDEIQKVIFKKIDSTHPGLIGYWDFDEPTGDVLVDHSVNQFNGTLKGSPVRVLSEVPVK